MDINAIINELRSSCGSLWNYKQRGQTFEIISPFSVLTHKFISVFITMRDGDFIVSDGGWVESGMYEVFPEWRTESFLKIFYQLEFHFRISTIEDQEKKKTFYAKFNNSLMLTSRIYDVCNFTTSLVNAAYIASVDKEVIQERESFKKEVNSFLSVITGNTDQSLRFNRSLDDEQFKGVRFDAIYVKNNKVTLIEYITGFDTSYFRRSICQTTTNFEIAIASKYKSVINHLIPVVNTAAPGYDYEELKIYLDLLETKTPASVINWEQRNRLRQYVE